MARLLITATYGYDNSTRAAMPFFVAKGAKESGIDVGIVLALDATVLVKPELRQYVKPHGHLHSTSFSSSPWTIRSQSTSEGGEPRLEGSWTKTSSVCQSSRRSTSNGMPNYSWSMTGRLLTK